MVLNDASVDLVLLSWIFCMQQASTRVLRLVKAPCRFYGECRFLCRRAKALRLQVKVALVNPLLYLVGGLDLPDRGQIWIADSDIATLGDPGRAALRRGTVGLVFQQFNLIPSLNVADNLAFHARLSGSEDVAWTADLAKRLGLSAFLSRFPEQLSGGQQQRVAIGRTLAARPALVLADEPTGNLDEATGDAVMKLLLELVSETGAGLLMVTHSKRLAGRLDRQVHLNAGIIA